jgi:hypothetical protein
MPNEELIKGLLIEREGYLARNKGARVREVDEQLEFLGYKSKTKETAEKVEVRETASVDVKTKKASK